jgi:hypothetical protein
VNVATLNKQCFIYIMATSSAIDRAQVRSNQRLNNWHLLLLPCSTSSINEQTLGIKVMRHSGMICLPTDCLLENRMIESFPKASDSLLTLPGHLSSLLVFSWVRITRSLVMCMFCTLCAQL